MFSTIKPIQLPRQIFPTAFTTTYTTNKPAVASLSQLEKLETLGRGSKGIVYKVRDNITRHVYALKMYNNSATCDEVLREIDILESIDCPYTTRFCGTVFSDSGDGFMPILMEYMEAGSLQNLVKINGALSEKMIVEVARRTLMGLDYLHNTKHIVHCDIKPANLLVDHNMEVKIADFGISKLIDLTSDQRQIFSGTTAYLAPERFDSCAFGDDLDVFAGDIWSLGLTLMEIYLGYSGQELSSLGPISIPGCSKLCSNLTQFRARSSNSHFRIVHRIIFFFLKTTRVSLFFQSKPCKPCFFGAFSFQTLKF
ncbi:MAPKK [Heracleum sosnowskyi]|uniref:mitogen-activated protein kinase kinase n=1 Tax=Heracleum sosnowskyi TaxID=360622 RepID=A0AAD8I1E0_9APIA|nr:MAPKK [Heracleum sosnowskyi]